MAALRAWGYASRMEQKFTDTAPFVQHIHGAFPDMPGACFDLGHTPLGQLAEMVANWAYARRATPDQAIAEVWGWLTDPARRLGGYPANLVEQMEFQGEQGQDLAIGFTISKAEFDRLSTTSEFTPLALAFFE